MDCDGISGNSQTIPGSGNFQGNSGKILGIAAVSAVVAASVVATVGLTLPVAPQLRSIA